MGQRVPAMRRTRSPSRAGTIQAIACTHQRLVPSPARSDLGGIAASIQPPGQGGVPQVAWSAGKPGDGKSRLSAAPRAAVNRLAE
jgi:hypothetical protein